MQLYRPVGPKELQLIKNSGFNRFPPRLPEQPIFYQYWIPAEDLGQFNDHIIGVIEVVEEYFSGEAHD